jgi:hypothetical protein
VWVAADDLTPRERSVAASHLNYVIGALGGRGFERLADFEETRIKGMSLAIDIEDIEALDEGGGFAFDAFYDSDVA